MVRDVLGEPRGASRRGPPDGVSSRGQRQHEEVVSLLSAWTLDQFGHLSFVDLEYITWRHLHVEERRLTARGARKVLGRLADFDVINLHGDLYRLRAASSVTHKLLGPGHRRFIQKRPI